MERPAGAGPVSTRRRGGALAAAVLLSLCAMLLAHGALLLARQEALASAAARSALAARAVAEWAALRAARERLPHASPDATILAEADSVSGALDGTYYRGSVRPLGGDLWMVEGEASAGAARARVGRPFRRPDPERLLRALGAVVSVGVAPEAGEVEGVDETTFQLQAEPAPPEGCAPAPPGSSPLAAWRVEEALAGGDPRDTLDPGVLAVRIPLGVAGAGRPAPRETGGLCAEGPWNWGDAARPGGACADRVPAVVAEHGTVAADGSGQALLVGRGDLTLSGVALYGGVVVAGRLRLDRGSVVTGFVRAGGGIEIRGGSAVSGSRCWAIRALSVDPVLAPVAIAGGGWMWLQP